MEGGAKRIVVIVAVAAVAMLGVFWYWQRSKQRALGSGNVYVKNQTTDQSAASSPPPSTDTAQTTSPATPAPTDESPSANAAQPSAKPSAGIEKTVHAQSAPVAQPSAAPAPMTQPRGALEVPATDTIPRNPPSGLIFAGAGKYQLYRQGDITWRLDTDNGRACIIFATDGQWSRTRVYDQGCGAS